MYKKLRIYWYQVMQSGIRRQYITNTRMMKYYYVCSKTVTCNDHFALTAENAHQVNFSEQKEDIDLPSLS